ncbi:MAG: TonB-dependent receptor [Bryobacteraceae bacterium]|nr:TonB-dependent receptor [Bryobacteraceae bacterium]
MQSRLALTLLALGSLCSGQDVRGRISGRVIDPSGAAVPNITVTATNADTQVRLSAITNEAGSYELPYLAPAVYNLEVAAPGFKQYRRSDLKVRVSDRLTVDIPLEIGATGESVTVSGQASLLETGTANVGQVFDTKRLLDLPLPGGNALSLARVAPGVVNLGVPNHPSLGPAVEVLSNISVNGVRSGNTEFTVDGTPSMWGTNAAYAPPAEMVAEFKVQTATYDASVGRSPGGSINVVLRSGTNKFRATLYEFHNNQVLTAMDLFQRQALYNPSTGPVTEAKRQAANPRNVLNRFGASVSGPVVLPKLYNGKNKTFFVYGFEMLTRPGIERGNSFYTVPTPKQRQGDFSELLALGPSYQIYDPATIQPAAGGRFSRQPFPGNIIPANRLDKTAVALMNYWPLPNTNGTADGRNNFTRLPQSYNEFHSNTGKVDHNFSDKHRVFLRYNQTWQIFTSGQIFDNTATGQDRFRWNYGTGFDDVYVFSASLLNNFRYGFTRFDQTTSPLSQGFDMTGAGFASSLMASIPEQARVFPQIQTAGIQTLGTNFPNAGVTNNHVFADDVTWTRSNHTIRFGGEFRIYREHNYNFNLGSPQIVFGNTYTRGPLDNSPVAPIGQGFASYLLGIPTDGSLNVNASSAEQSTTLAFFIQDDWRISPKVSVNVGLRYDYDSPITERFNRSVRGFDSTVASPIEAQAKAAYAASPIPEIPVSQFQVKGGLLFAGVNGQSRSLWESDRNNFAPRIGITWNPLKATVIRTGYGIYYVPLGADRSTVNQSGYSLRNGLVPSLDNGVTYTASLSNPFPGGIAQPAGAAGGLSTDIGRSVSFFNSTPRNGYMQRFSLGVQQELPGAVLLDVGYIGNRGTKLVVNRPYNAVPVQYLSRTGSRDQATIDRLTVQVNNPFFPLPGTDIAGRTVARTQLLRPFPQYTGVNGDDPIGYSWFHSMQMRAERRFSKGFTAQFNYTWSKFMEASGFLNAGDTALEEVISDLDRSHRATLTGIWELPFGRGRALFAGAPGIVDHVIGGWQLQAVWQRNTGAPLNLGNVLLTGDIRGLGNVEQTFDRWFNTSIFNRNPQEQLAQNYRMVSTRFAAVRNPDQEVWDLSIVKNWKIRELTTLQFRGEALNALNRSNMASPNTDPTNTLFGRITATSGNPRYIHLGLKLIF